MNQRIVDMIYVALLLSLAGFLYYSTNINYIVYGMPLYPESTQKLTGTYVRSLAVCLAVLSVLLLIKTLRQEAKNITGLIGNPKKFIKLIILLIIYTYLISKLGFFTSSFIFLPATMLVMGYKNYLVIGLSTVGLLTFIYVLFAKVFEVPLPEAEYLAEDYIRIPFDKVHDVFSNLFKGKGG